MIPTSTTLLLSTVTLSVVALGVALLEALQSLL